MGWNTLRGVGHASDCEHHHVLHLTLQRSAYDRLILTALLYIPAKAQLLIRHLWPGYFLPDHVVLKRQKTGWDTEFENEKAMYSRLRPLQGDVIPTYYGEAQCDNTPAIIMQDVQGQLPFGQQKPFLSLGEFRSRLQVAYDALRSFGVMTDDIKLANVLLVGGKAVLVDLESLWEPERDDWEHFRQTSIEELVDQYRSCLKSYASQ